MLTSLVLFGVLATFLIFSFVHSFANDDCSNFNSQNGCQGQQTEYPPSWQARQFQTPRRGDASYKNSYQDMGLLVGYASIQYTNTLRTKAIVTVYTQVNSKSWKQGTTSQLMYYYNTIPSNSNCFAVDSSTFGNTTLQIKVELQISSQNIKAATIASLILDPLDFIWNSPKIANRFSPDDSSIFEKGQKGAIVELFGWPYSEIEKECSMIAKAGYLGIKVFPPQEAVASFDQPQNGELFPWYWIYQPVSYRLNSRWGTRKELRKMIYTCRSLGLRVYADAVVNHMAANGNDMFSTHRNGNGGSCTYWGAKNSSDPSNQGSPFYAQGYAYQNVSYTGLAPGMEFPSVPYGPTDFHCERVLSSWTDPFILNYGWLVGLSDLNTEKDYVRQRIADYFTDLLSIGFSGFRIDAAKHISPDNLAAIFAKFRFNMGNGDLPDDFLTYLEVIIGGEKDLLMCNMNPYNFGPYFEQALKNAGLSDADVYKIKIWDSAFPKEVPVCGSWVIPSERLAIENDCHDDQFPGSSSRDMGDQGSVLNKDKDVNKHRYFEKNLFERTDANWKIRLLLSSYTFRGNALAPPDGKSDCNLCTSTQCKQQCTLSMPLASDGISNPNVCGYTCVDAGGNWQQGVYTRVHRDMSIIQSVRKWMGLNTNFKPQDVGLPSQCTL